MSKPDVDILTNKTFAEEKKDMGLNMEDFMPAISFDASSMQDIDIIGIIKDAMSSEAIGAIIEKCTFLDLTDDEVRQLVIKAVDDYVDNSGGQTIEQYFDAPYGDGYH